MNLYEHIKEQREVILNICDKHGALNVRVFGSVVKNEDSESSDIDFLIDLGENRTPFFPGGLIVELEELLGKKVDIAIARSLKPRIKDKILNEAKAL